MHSLARAKGHHDSRLASRFTIMMARFDTIHDSPGVTIHDDQNNFTIHDPDYFRALTIFPACMEDMLFVCYVTYVDLLSRKIV